MKRTFVSFDVFDTCLIRRCGRPEKIWDLMAERLFDKEDNRSRMSFVGNRSCVEERLRNLGNVHATLDDIYTELRTEQWGFCKERLMQLEMDVEEQELFPNPEIVKLVEDCRSKDFTIAFISDMYLPSSFLKRILQKYGFYKESDFLFVSAECKAEKYDGALFDYVFQQTGTKARQWIHYGDNKRSDFYVPKSKGVKSRWISNTDFTNEEKRWLSDAWFYPHKHDIELWAGICRLTRIQNEQCDRAAMAVDFIASNYVPYVFWILETAQNKGVRRLFFLGRDGHIFYEIATQVKNCYPEIEISYLKISRKAIYSSMFIDGNEEEILATIGNSCDQRISSLLNQIGFDYNDLSDVTKIKYSTDFRLFEKNKKGFVEDLLKNDVGKIVECSQKCRGLLLDYLKQENVLGCEKSAFVDLGWYGSCRCNLNYILRKEGYCSIPTFYWGVYDKLLYGKRDDNLYIFQKQFGLGGTEHSFLNEFMEHYASMNSDGSTIGYSKRDNEIIPVEKDFDLNSSEWMKINEKSVVSLCRNVLDISISSWNEIFLCCGLKQLVRMYNNPSKKNVMFFSDLRIENFGREVSFVQKLSLKNILALLVWGRPTELTWIAASIYKTFGFFAPMFTKLYQATNLTSLAMKLRVWWDGRK